MHIGNRIPPIVLVALLLTAPAMTADGGLIIYTDRNEFLAAVEDLEIMNDDFTDLNGEYYGNPIVRGEETPFEYMLQSSTFVGLLSIGDLISTLYPNSALEFSAGDSGLSALGGEFGLVDYNGVSDPGALEIGLQDGSSYSLDLDDGLTFFGIIGDGESITSLTVASASKTSLVTASAMVLAAVPAPSTVALLALPVLGPRRRRSGSLHS
tara:strand:+ start:2165 stop:2794 length:630 start_codon:yes stop_codon:yes gene_type:complete